MSDFSKYSLERIRKTIDIYTNKLLEVELDESPDLKKIETIESELELLDSALKEKTKPSVASPSLEATPGQSSAVPGYSGIQKELQNSFRDVSSFESGCDVHVFINRLEVFYNMYVKGTDCDQKEQMFVRLGIVAKRKLGRFENRKKKRNWKNGKILKRNGKWEYLN